MGSCRGRSSSLHRSRYVSWCVDSPPTANTTLTTTATPEEFPHQNQESADAGSSVPLVLLSPPETSGGETDATLSHQLPQSTSTSRTNNKALTDSQSNPQSSTTLTLHNTDKATNSHSDEGEDYDSEKGRKENSTPSEADNSNKEDQSPLHPEDKGFYLPRSSPVISRRHRPISWHGGSADTSAPSSLNSPSPASGSLSLDQHGCLTVTSMKDLASKPSSSRSSSPVQEDKKPACVSVSSNLNHFLSPGFHLPFSGQQGLVEEHRGQGPTSSDAPHTSGLSISTQHSRERRSIGIPEFSADVFKTTCELEKENAHFIVVDMVLEVLEGAKWTLSFDQRTSMMDTHQHTHYSMCTQRHTGSAVEHKQRRTACRRTRCWSTMDTKQEDNKNRHSDGDNETSHRNTHSSQTYTHPQQGIAGNTEHHPKTFSVLSTDSGFGDCGVDTTLTQRNSLRNAEWLAEQLVLEFRKNWLPSHVPRRNRQSLRSSLQELPGTGGVAVSSGSLTEEIRLRTRMRGSLCWAPPRFQIIFTVQPTHRRNEVVASQHFLCAGCGTQVEPRYIKKLRYCEYLGRYFCDCCHSGSEAVIPGRVLSCWDFGRYAVSDFSKQLLDTIWHQPLFDLDSVGKTLYSKVKELDKFRELREQLLGIKKLLKACRLSGRIMTEFEQLPCHLTEQPHLFSMDDLFRVKKGQLVAQAKAVLRSTINHVENCELCLARGFICEFCRERNIIFPFQSDICKRCPVCKACFHKQCFVEKKCPKCARMQLWKQTF